jgi:hydroxymethylbilane synthase
MRLKIGSRKSDLARWQAVQVARVFERVKERPSVEYIFKSSLGDQNLDIPLAGMGARGVFTEDFYEDLLTGRCDLVVHSWKDLPVEERADTTIAMTLPRADVRDLLLVTEAAWAEAENLGRLKVFTSSPRRVYNLQACLKELLPGAIECEFLPVRGNVPTRLKKMREEGAALILAKAGLDRLLAAEKEKFADNSLHELLKECRFQVLPISLNPPAPAQGALAVEIKRDREDLEALCASLNHEETMACVRRERETLSRYGGGCHQKIGVAILAHEYGRVISLRGQTDQGEVLLEWKIENSTPWTKARSKDALFPYDKNSWFKRVPLEVKADLSARPGLFVARAEAFPSGFQPGPRQVIWTAGVQTWRRLARQGVWVNGSQDGLGERNDFGLATMCGEISFTKLTHAQAAGPEDIATYRLERSPSPPDLKGKTHFFWTSQSAFELARALFPNEIKNGVHGCGPGHTAKYLAEAGLSRPVKVFIDREQFIRESLP